MSRLTDCEELPCLPRHLRFPFPAPAATPFAYALFAHCFTCSKESKAATYVSAALAEHGIAVLRFDFTGLGGSGGDFASTNFTSNVEDLVTAADCLWQHHRAPSVLVGKINPTGQPARPAGALLSDG